MKSERLKLEKYYTAEKAYQLLLDDMLSLPAHPDVLEALFKFCAVIHEIQVNDSREMLVFTEREGTLNCRRLNKKSLESFHAINHMFVLEELLKQIFIVQGLQKYSEMKSM